MSGGLRRREILAGGLAAATLPLGVALPAGPARAAGGTVKMGLIMAMSGPGAGLGETMSRGVDLYTKTHKSGLPDGVTLQIIRRDDASNPDTTKRLAQELAVRDKVQLLAGITLSPQGFSVASVATEAKIPTILMNATTGSITRSSPYLVRFSHSNWQMAHTIGVWAAKNGIKSAYTLVADYAAGTDMEAAFNKGFTDGGGTITASDRSPINTNDFMPYMERIKAAKPEALFIFMIAGRATLSVMKAYGDSGLAAAGVKLIGPGDVVPDDQLAEIGPHTVGMVNASIYTASYPGPANKAFLDAWHAEYGATSMPDFPAIGAWNAMDAVYGLIREQGVGFTGDGAMQFLSHWKSDAGPAGPISIDPETRDIVQNVYLCRVEKAGSGYDNKIFDTMTAVKDPWKVFNPAK